MTGGIHYLTDEQGGSGQPATSRCQEPENTMPPCVGYTVIESSTFVSNRWLIFVPTMSVGDLS